MIGATANEQLADRVGELLGPRHPIFAAATVTPAAATVTARGTGLDAAFEIASVSKAITGLLYADSLVRGEIGRDSTLGALLPLGDVPAAAVTVESISIHRSRLPGLPGASHPLRRTIALWRHGVNPYGENLDQLLAQARGVEVGKPRAHYSTFAFELLGHAIASAVGTTFAELIRDRLAGPLGLGCLYVPATTDRLRANALTGRSKSGKPCQPWTGEALGPAGGIRSCIRDLAKLAAALLAGSAPGGSSPR